MCEHIINHLRACKLVQLNYVFDEPCLRVSIETTGPRKVSFNTGTDGPIKFVFNVQVSGRVISSDVLLSA